MAHAIERRRFTVAGRTVGFLHAGAEAPAQLAVFLHAFPLNADMWRPQLAALPAGWAGVAPDYRGFGQSDPDRPSDAGRAGARIEDYAADVAALMDDLGAPGAALCGCSLGGYVALAALRLFPARIAGLLLADTRATADLEAARAGRLAALDRLDREGPAAVGADMRPKLLGGTSRAHRPGVVAAVDRLTAAATADGVGYALARMMNRPDASDALRAFGGLVTVVVGGEDTLTPPADAEALAALAPGSTLRVIPGAGHLPNLEDPGSFNAAMVAWLQAIDAATA